jgi:hypothetical protein
MRTPSVWFQPRPRRGLPASLPCLIVCLRPLSTFHPLEALANVTVHLAESPDAGGMLPQSLLCLIRF